MKRILCRAMWIAALSAPTAAAAQESVPEVEGPWPGEQAVRAPHPSNTRSTILRIRSVWEPSQ